MIQIKKERLVREEWHNRLWEFYEKTLGPLNEDSPISQTFPQDTFCGWLVDEDVVKVIALDGDELVGLGLISSDLSHDPLISIPYFERHFADRPIFHIPALSVDPKYRVHVGVKIIRGIIEEVPPNSVVIYFHSKGTRRTMRIRNAIAAVASEVIGVEVTGQELDAEACCVYYSQTWPMAT